MAPVGVVQPDMGVRRLSSENNILNVSSSEKDSADPTDTEPSPRKARASSWCSDSTRASLGAWGRCASIREECEGETPGNEPAESSASSQTADDTAAAAAGAATAPATAPTPAAVSAKSSASSSTADDTAAAAAVTAAVSRQGSLHGSGRRSSLGYGRRNSLRRDSLRRNSLVSLGAPSSDARYAEPAQTMIVLDWDDTLFPRTELFERWGINRNSDDPAPPDKEEAMQAWRDALSEYLAAAAALSDRCVVITNSRKPWVDICIRRFAPQLAELFDDSTADKRRLKVVYSMERLSKCKKLKDRQTDLRPVMHRKKTQEDFDDEQTRAKYTAMKQEAAAFYSRYRGQSWKNVISIGDMRYEHDAVTELGYRRNPKRPEKLRTKAIIVPTGPSISELTHRLLVGRLLLPAYVHHDDDLDLDLHKVADPLAAIGDALRLPQLKDVPLSRHAWGREPAPEDLEEVEEALDDIAVIVHNSLFG